jgi:competence protein ComEC
MRAGSLSSPSALSAPSKLAAPAALVLGVLFGYAGFFLRLPQIMPGAMLASTLAVCSLAALFMLARHRSLGGLFVLAGLVSSSWVLQAQLHDRYNKADSTEPIEITGRISGLPEVREGFTRFRFQPINRDDPAAPSGPGQVIPGEILAYWYRDAPVLQPGQTWHLEVKLKPPWGLVNFQGHDRERWLFAEGLGALATVRQGQLLADGGATGWLDRSRQRLAEDILAAPSSATSKGVVAALAVADRSAVTREQNRILSLTGTSHLLAISGLHVGLAYLCAYWFVRLVLLPLGPWLRHGQRWCLVAGWAVAFAYAGLAGFSTATVRALIMLSVVLLLFLLRRSIHPLHSWMLALAAVLLIDPLAALQAGAWMSFVAVAALLLAFAPRRAGATPGVGNYLNTTLRAQWAVMVFCFPFTAWWFQMSSPAGFPANLLAIPWVSFLVVPLVLLALVMAPLWPAAFDTLVNLAARACDGMMSVLRVLAAPAADFSSVLQPGWSSLLLAILAALILLLPRGLRMQAPALLLFVPLLLPAQPAGAGNLQLDVLDAGQGTALLLQTGGKLLLYDSGPGDNEGEVAGHDLVDSVITPAVLATGRRRPDRVIISHGDLDHAGGMASLQGRYPGVPMHASLPETVAGIEPCDDTLAWSWQGSEFRVLHPSPWLPYRGNDSSCVLDVNAGTYKLLLSGDISSQVERRLLRRQLDVYRVLLVPHHGSKSSSDPALLHASIPEWAFATAGAGNRFGFPRAEVKQRYRDAGIALYSTDQCGALRLRILADGSTSLQSARRVRQAPWRWPAGPDCP